MHVISYQYFHTVQANLIVQEARLKVAMTDLNKAQSQLDDKQRELDVVQALYDSAVNEKQVLSLEVVLV